MPLYAVYVLFFRESGLSVAQISSLLAIWSVVTFVVEIPSGAVADAVSRRLLLVIAAVLTGAAFTVWIVAPTYWGFAAGFVLWGLSTALQSGTFQALMYDELAREGRASSYARVMGFAESASMLTTLLAYGVAAPMLVITGGSIEPLGWFSVGTAVVQAVLAAGFPDPPRTEYAEEEAASYRAILTAGVAEAARSRPVVRAVIVVAALAGVLAVDEYTPLVADDLGATVVQVPLLLVLPAVGQMVGAALAGRTVGMSTRTASTALLVAAVAMGVVPFVGVVAAFAALSVALGVLWNLAVVAEATLQDSITGASRATVMSVSGFVAELGALVLIAWFAWGPTPVVATAGLAVATLLLIPAVIARDRAVGDPPAS